MKVILYARVSTEEQSASGVSLSAQQAKLQQYAELFDLEVTDVILDAGQSAKDLNRPGLQAALAALDEGKAEGLVVCKLDRLTRSVRDLADLLERYFGTRFALHSVAEKVDTSSAAGRMILNIMTTVAQFEREQVGERTSAALQFKISQGEHVGAPPLGFKMVDGDLQKVDSEQETIDRIAELRSEGHPLREIATILGDEGRKTKRGGDWHPQTVARVVKRLEAQR